MEGRVLLSTVSDGGTSTLTFQLGLNEGLSVQSAGSTYTFTLDNANDFTDGGVANSGDFSGFGTNSLVLESSGVARYSTLDIVDTAAGASVDLLDSGTNTYSSNINITLDNGPAAPSVQLSTTTFTGSAGLNVSTTGAITMPFSGGITTASGSVMLAGNTAGTDSVDAVGVNLNAPITSASGAITLTGIGGENNNSGVGVRLINGGKVTTTSGPITITGYVGTGGDGDGVEMINTVILPAQSTGVTSATGNISITGTAATNGTGIDMTDQVFVGSTGTGATAATITIDGTGGADGAGFRMDSFNSQVTSVDGNISITGSTSSSATNTPAIYILNDSSVDSTGTDANAATITINGMGGANNSGFRMDSSSGVTSVEGKISITGTTSATTNPGIYILNSSSVTSTGTDANAATITINGTETSGNVANYGIYMFSSGDVNSVDGAINITGMGGNGIAVNNSSVNSTGTAPITLDGTASAGYGDYIGTATVTSVDGNISIAGSTAGTTGYEAVYVFNVGKIMSTGTDANAGSITIDGTSTSTGGGEGVVIDNGGSGGALISTAGAGANAGPITIMGTSVSSHGVYLQGTGVGITSVDGDISITGGTSTSNNVDAGVYTTNGVSITTTGTDANAGSITMNGTNTGAGRGVFFNNSGSGGATVSTVGEGADAGAISITGNTDSTGSYGIEDLGLSALTLSSVDGNLLLDGTTSSSLTAAIGLNVGAGTIASTGAGTITLDGADTGVGVGVLIDQTGAGVTTATGAISISGSSNHTTGVEIISDTIQSTSGGTVTVSTPYIVSFDFLVAPRGFYAAHVSC